MQVTLYTSSPGVELDIFPLLDNAQWGYKHAPEIPTLPKDPPGKMGSQASASTQPRHARWGPTAESAQPLRHQSSEAPARIRQQPRYVQSSSFPHVLRTVAAVRCAE